MTFAYGDRVQETFTTTGTGTISLGGPITGYQAFSAVLSNSETCYYMATDGTNWEAGIGTYASSGNTLARTTVQSSSNGGSAVSWGAGTKSIWLNLNAAGLPTAAGVTGTGQMVLANSPSLITPALGTPTSGDLANCTGLGITQGAAVALSGTSVSWSIPTTANRIILSFAGLKTSGSSNMVCQIGTGGTLTSTGYASIITNGGSTQATSTIGFVFTELSANTYLWNGTITLTRITGNQWTATVSSGTPTSTGFMAFGTGSITLGGAINIIGLTPTNGTDTFTAGEANIQYE